MSSKKASQLVMDRTTGVILAVIFIILIIGIFIHFNPAFLYKLLPEYNVPGENGDEIIPGTDLLATKCSGGDVVGLIGSGSGSEVPILMGANGERQISLTYKKTDPNSADLVIKTPASSQIGNSQFFRYWDPARENIIVGKVNNGKVTIEEIFLNENNEMNTNILFGRPPFNDPLVIVDFTAKDLAILDGAKFEHLALFCKSTGELSKSYFSTEKWFNNNILLLEKGSDSAALESAKLVRKIGSLLGTTGTVFIQDNGDSAPLSVFVNGDSTSTYLGVVANNGYLYITYNDLPAENFNLCKDASCGGIVIFSEGGLSTGEDYIGLDKRKYHATNIHISSDLLKYYSR